MKAAIVPKAIAHIMVVCALLELLDLLGLSKKYPYLKQALSQKTCFSENARKCAHFCENAYILCKLDENAHISKENVHIFIGKMCTFSLKMCAFSSKDPYPLG